MGNTGSSATSFGKCGTCSQGGTYFFGASKSTNIMQRTDRTDRTGRTDRTARTDNAKKAKEKRYYKGYIVHKNKKGRYILKKKRKVYLKSGARTYSTKEVSLSKKTRTARTARTVKTVRTARTNMNKKSRFG